MESALELHSSGIVTPRRVGSALAPAGRETALLTGALGLTCDQPECEDLDVADKLQLAVENNARWCDLVCRSSGVDTSLQDGVWVARQPSPRLYPEAITLRENVATEAVVAQLPRGDCCSVKDSFTDLDLANHGFEELFTARWMYCDPAARSGRTHGWTVVDTPEGFADWTAAAGLAGALPVVLIADPTVRILKREDPQGIVEGAVLNRTGLVVGVSNVFSQATPADRLWADLIAFAAGAFGSVPLVAYGRGHDLAAAVAGGFVALGPLTVWQHIS